MNEFKVRILHISDLHERGARERSGWRRRRVLGNAWNQNLEALLQEGPLHFVCFTGDIADWGLSEEYEHATDFIFATLERIKLDADRLFLVPGNHDINRRVKLSVWKSLRKYLPDLHAQDVSRWLSGEALAPRGATASHADTILERQDGYREWLKTINREALLPQNSAHGRLGYRSTLRIPGLPFNIHVIGLDSAWLAGDDNDNGKLRLTEDQVMLLSTDNGEPLDGFRLALMHHPLDELADGSDCRRLLAEHVDLLMRGHLHESEPQTWADPERILPQLAAGCLYEGHRADRYPNSCYVLDLYLDANGRPLKYEVWFRGWAERGHWFNDDRLYSGSRNGRLVWTVDHSRALPRSKSVALGLPVTEATSAPDYIRDTLYSTLLPVIRMPRYVYSAFCDYSDRQERAAQKEILPSQNSGEMYPFIIRGGMIHCFHNLKNPTGPFRRLIANGKIIRWESWEWWDHEDRSRWFAHLLNRALNKLTGRRGLNLDKEHKRYYFTQQESGKPLEVDYRPLNKATSTRSVVWQPISQKTGEPRSFWNHLAVSLQFHRVSSKDWCLSIRPEMRVTKDGQEPIASERIGSKVTRTKSRLYNYDLLEEINFWRDYLSGSQPRIVFEFGKGQHIVVSTSIMSAPINWPGIPEEYAKKFTNVEYEDDLFSQAALNRLDVEYAEDSEEDEESAEDWEDEEFDSFGSNE
jgi:predicted MPP superfamily phosphohydrolase